MRAYTAKKALRDALNTCPSFQLHPFWKSHEALRFQLPRLQNGLYRNLMLCSTVIAVLGRCGAALASRAPRFGPQLKPPIVCISSGREAEPVFLNRLSFGCGTGSLKLYSLIIRDWSFPCQTWTWMEKAHSTAGDVTKRTSESKQCPGYELPPTGFLWISSIPSAFSTGCSAPSAPRSNSIPTCG